ncbi:hypothetical protein PT7_0332 [Pusillimonas sp. T7-7]|uniref:TcpQ domain-containing protein n=1 Tax=Pusillimonas sp. (strain T7-7) TaxID=1007105 RepID=UPI0002084C57|nr:TcpQ domain-containing protein [Pusillimonas sp. T7-7]AEC18872.1 hypothetical protein PT7_0332 [Pusillimonas sp. T7-7]
MQLQTVVATLVAACLVAGCGFTPKQPPKPDESRRVSVNKAAPYLHPWPPPQIVHAHQTSTASQFRNSAFEPASTINHVNPNLQINGDTLSPSLTAHKELGTHVEQLANGPTMQHRSDDKSIASNEHWVDKTTAPIAVWPITTVFKPLDSIEQNDGLRKIVFQWPSAPLPDSQIVPTPPSVQPASIPADTYPIELASLAPAISLDIVQPLAHVSDLMPVKAVDEPSAAREPVPTHEANPTIELASNVGPTDLEPIQTEQEDPKLDTPGIEQTWSAQRNSKLSDVLREWGAQESWTIEWQSSVDFAIEAAFSIQAPDFLGAANYLFKAYRDAGCEFAPKAYSNQVIEVPTPKDCRS